MHVNFGGNLTNYRNNAAGGFIALTSNGESLTWELHVELKMPFHGHPKLDKYVGIN
jgi:hypothetical protein